MTILALFLILNSSMLKFTLKELEKDTAWMVYRVAKVLCIISLTIF